MVRIPILYSKQPLQVSGNPIYRQDKAYDEASSLHRQSAAPPIYIIAFIFVPLAVAIHIATTRYQDGTRHGIDVVFSSIIGTIAAYFGFGLYHLPIGRGAGRSWSPRSRDRAFKLNFGELGYAGSIRVENRREELADIDSGPANVHILT